MAIPSSVARSAAASRSPLTQAWLKSSVMPSSRWFSGGGLARAHRDSGIEGSRSLTAFSPSMPNDRMALFPRTEAVSLSWQRFQNGGLGHLAHRWCKLKCKSSGRDHLTAARAPVGLMGASTGPKPSAFIRGSLASAMSRRAWPLVAKKTTAFERGWFRGLQSLGSKRTLPGCTGMIPRWSQDRFWTRRAAPGWAAHGRMPR